ncbi:MAG: glycosyltransferase [Lachnospiraceae bacterium]|nr:glycosyltransferase [Lachnospiraceae bacterium]
MLLSIIIPVYNVEQYLERCIDSILSQGEDSFEVILVDDGSTDRSNKICDSCAVKHSFIKAFHKTNGGLSSARNYGINHANGKYLLFLDSDDYLEPSCLRRLMTCIKDHMCDVIFARAYTVDESGNRVSKTRYTDNFGEYRNSNCFLSRVFKSKDDILMCAPFYICKKEFLINNNLYFKEGIIHEDELWTPSVLIKAERIYYSEIYFYNHYMRENSIMHSDNLKRSVNDTFEVCLKLEKLYSGEKQSNTKILRNRMCILFLRAALRTDDLDDCLRQFGRNFAWVNAYTFKQRAKAFLFMISPNAYTLVGRSRRSYK